MADSPLTKGLKRSTRAARKLAGAMNKIGPGANQGAAQGDTTKTEQDLNRLGVLD